MAFRALLTNPERKRRAPDLHLIFNARTRAVVGMHPRELPRDAMLRSLAKNYPGQYAPAGAWCRLGADGAVEIWFDADALALPECYRDEFERMCRDKLEAKSGIH